MKTARKRISIRHVLGCGLLALLMLSPMFSGATQAHGGSAKSELPQAISMFECEGPQCFFAALWSLHGNEGEARWRNGVVAKLAVERFDASSVVVRRTDTSGSTQGLTGIYTGSRRGDHIEGTATWTWPGHWDGKSLSGPWSGVVDTATAENSARSQLGGNYDLSGVWETVVPLGNAPGIIQASYQQSGDRMSAKFGDATFWVARFVNDSLIIGRAIRPGSPPGNPIWDAQALYIDDNDHMHNLDGVRLWRALPGGEDASCEAARQEHIPFEYSFVRGLFSIAKRNDYQKAACWFQRGADQGFGKSQGVLAYLYYLGNGVPQDYTRAFALAQKSAQQNDYFGELVLGTLYKEGKGTAADPVKAKEWLAKGEAQRPKVPQQKPLTVGDLWGRMSPEQRQFVVNSALSIFNFFAESEDYDEQVQNLRYANRGMSLSSAEHMVDERRRREQGIETDSEKAEDAYFLYLFQHLK